MRKILCLAVLTALAVPAAALADAGGSGSLMLAPSFESGAPAGSFGSAGALAPTTLALTTPFVGGVAYRPRHYRSSQQVMPVTTQLHVGFFDPDGDIDAGFNCGFRMGPQVDPHVQVGLAMDWWHRTENEEMSIGSYDGPGGEVDEHLVLSESSLDLVPVLGFVQVSGDENMAIIPYAGFGIGYEWLFLTSDDYVAGESFDETFGGFGYQVWGGVGVSLDGRTRLNGEVFYNGCEAGSDVDVYLEDYGPVTVRDEIKMNGVGMRVGLSWGF